MADLLHLVELEGDKKIPVEMLVSEAMIIEVMLVGAIEQLGPHVGADPAVAEFLLKASGGLAAIRASIAQHEKPNG